ncbi:hypothetical protein ACJMK2_016152 [Sinanodonta woodiana]|uniref:Cyclin-Q n=1 Tax=Sinanodonta woodiana TaxID=1069815 RepID=A0ABD3USQ8_SINWO
MSDNEGRVHFRVVRFINESGLKLHLKSVPLAAAAIIYHKFFRDNKLKDFDPYLIGTTCLYLAAKVEEQLISLRDVVNVAYRTLHRNKPALEIGDTYYLLRDSVARCELYILRALQFKVIFNLPHKYLIHYLKFLKDWFEPYQWEELPIACTAWACLRDFYHCSVCLTYKPQHLAVGVLYFAMLCLGVEVPYHKQAELKWWKVFAEDLTIDEIKEIIKDIMSVYEMESTINT